MIDELMDCPAIYCRGGMYTVEEWSGGGREFVTCVDTTVRAARLAAIYQADLDEEIDMAKKEKKSNRVVSPKEPKAKKSTERDPRIPPAGTILRKSYKGKVHEVRVNQDDFTYEGTKYKILSHVARDITKGRYEPPKGHGISGFVFFKTVLSKKTGG